MEASSPASTLMLDGRTTTERFTRFSWTGDLNKDRQILVAQVRRLLEAYLRDKRSEMMLLSMGEVSALIETIDILAKPNL